MTDKEPLAARLRPRSLDEFVGQAHLVGPGKPLRAAMEQGHRFSFILWGPPGVGKTTLARLYAQALAADLTELSAVSAGKDDLRKLAARAGDAERPQLLFLDEIHRFNKAQQDFLLPIVESGVLTLVGTTTENPSFEVIPALLSRCRVFILHELSGEELAVILRRAEPDLAEDALEFLVRLAAGDARQALTVLEGARSLYGTVTAASLADALQSRTLRFDKAGEEHYNTVSAFIKSLRAGNADAALYYLARMVEAGEDPKFIARRMVIFASEDVGLAQPTALVVANAVFRAVETVGLPEAGINLAHGAAYLCHCKKDRRAYDGYQRALAEVRRSGSLPVPLKLRNAPTTLMQAAGYGKGYAMYDEGDLLPAALKGARFLDDSAGTPG